MMTVCFSVSVVKSAKGAKNAQRPHTFLSGALQVSLTLHLCTCGSGGNA